jgi:hypothetical protein
VLVAASMVPFVLMAAGVLVVAVALAADRFATKRPQAERRRSTRATAARPVVVRHASGEARTFALDLSEGGILIAGPEGLAIGDTVTLTVEFDDATEPRTAEAAVVRHTPQGYVGLRFV